MRGSVFRLPDRQHRRAALYRLENNRASWIRGAGEENVLGIFAESTHPRDSVVKTVAQMEQLQLIVF